MIQSIELREIRLPLMHFFETSSGRATERRMGVARGRDADGAEGWGEFPAGEGPFYSDEWTDSGWDTLCEFLGPMVLRQEVDSAGDVFGLMKPVRGHRMGNAKRGNSVCLCGNISAARAVRSPREFRSAFRTRRRSCSTRSAKKSPLVINGSRSRSNPVGTCRLSSGFGRTFPRYV